MPKCMGCVQVPLRRVQLTDNNGYFDLYDTSGPQVCEGCLLALYVRGNAMIGAPAGGGTAEVRHAAGL
jgi:hypothetical protein